jgi:esterase/lipase superfamily enzyme
MGSNCLLISIEPEASTEIYGQRHAAPLFVGNDEKNLDTIKTTLKDHVKAHKKILLLTHGFNVQRADFLATCDHYAERLEEDDVAVIGFYWNCPTTCTTDSVCRFRKVLCQQLKSYYVGFIANWIPEAIFRPIILYSSSAEKSSFTARSLYYILIALCEHKDANNDVQIHLLAHSMGTRIVMEALKILAHDASFNNRILEHFQGCTEATKEHVAARFPNMISSITLKQGDMDVNVFRQIWTYFRHRTFEFTRNLFVFYRNDDNALKLSSAIHGDSRIGQNGINLAPEDDNVSEFQTDVEDGDFGFPLNHSYWTDERFIERIRRIIVEHRY